jgi:hypothetical protein
MIHPFRLKNINIFESKLLPKKTLKRTPKDSTGLLTKDIKVPLTQKRPHRRMTDFWIFERFLTLHILAIARVF